MNEVVVAAVQFNPKILDVHKNLAVAKQLTFEAAGKGARIIVLPELCISGYNLKSAAEAASVCQEKSGYQTEAFIPLARKFNCHIVFGYVELREGKFYNSAAVVGPSGLVGYSIRVIIACRNHTCWTIRGFSLSRYNEQL